MEERIRRYGNEKEQLNKRHLAELFSGRVRQLLVRYGSVVQTERHSKIYHAATEIRRTRPINLPSQHEQITAFVEGDFTKQNRRYSDTPAPRRLSLVVISKDASKKVFKVENDQHYVLVMSSIPNLRTLQRGLRYLVQLRSQFLRDNKE